jgi:hypothetical protein
MKNHMRYVIILILGLVANIASAQQVNPVPDYTFANRMSAGRNTVTDTAAYFSIGPRYGAIRGMMPPMVVDTASVSGNKRNGLLIFSVQKNKFLYWDSVGVKWAEMAGTAGSAITGTGVAGYMPEFTTSTNIDSTSLYHSAGRFAIGSTTISNGRFSVFGGQSYFDTSLKVGSQTLLADEGKNEVYINTNIDSGAFTLQVGGGIYSTTGSVLAAASGQVGIGISPSYKLDVNGFGRISGNTFLGVSSGSIVRLGTINDLGIGQFGIQTDGGTGASIGIYSPSTSNGGRLVFNDNVYSAEIRSIPVDPTGTSLAFRTNNAERMRITTDGSVGINTTSPGHELEVYSTGTDTRIIVTSSTTGAGASKGVELITSGGDGYVYNYYNGAFIFGTNATERARITNAGELLIGSSTDQGAYALQVTGAILNTTTITTGAPTSGTAKPWRLGEAATASPTSPNRTIRVEIDGTVYYIHAKTTND